MLRKEPGMADQAAHVVNKGKQIGLPLFPFDKNPPSETRIGEHTKEVLMELGYKTSEIEAMERKNAIKVA